MKKSLAIAVCMILVMAGLTIGTALGEKYVVVDVVPLTADDGDFATETPAVEPLAELISEPIAEGTPTPVPTPSPTPTPEPTPTPTPTPTPEPEWPDGFAYDFSDRQYLLPINAETGSNPKLNGYTENGYKDSTIEVTISSGHKFDCDYWVADIMIQDPSQLRTMAGGMARSFEYKSEEDAIGLAKKSKGVVVINGDFYTQNDRGGLGFVLRQGAIYMNNLDTPGKWNSKMMDVLLIDEDGDFHGLHQPAAGSIPRMINGKRILNAFSFGPILVENGVAVKNFERSDTWVNMASDTLKQRMCICQVDTLHYKAICCSGPSHQQPGMYMKDFAQVAAEEGVRIAYNLDGGDSTMLYFRDKAVNIKRIGSLRKIHDIIYFASAER